MHKSMNGGAKNLPTGSRTAIGPGTEMKRDLLILAFLQGGGLGSRMANYKVVKLTCSASPQAF